MHIAMICTDSDLWAFGTRLISAVLKRAGHSTKLILLASEAAEYSPDVLQELAESARQADVVGLSCYSRGSLKAKQVAAKLREHRKPVVWGGLHASLNPQECAQACDIVCRGEGEETILELIAALERGRGWEEIRNLAYLRNGTAVLNPLRPPIPNLDDLPLLDFERTAEFHLRDGHIVQASSDPRLAHSRRLQYIGSRGCAFHCTYCCNRKVKEMYAGNGKYLRRMSAARYIEQLATLRRQAFPDATDVFLLDEDFFLRSLEEVREFAELYREHVDLPLDCMVSAPRVTDEKVRLMADAGMWRISLGVESGSERTKKEVFERPIRNDIVLRASQTIDRYRGVIPVYFFIIGNPYEERQDLLDTLALMMRLTSPFYSNIYNLVFFPGSELFERAVRDGIIQGSGDSGFELHFRAGLKIRDHTWKQKQVYLNALLFLTDGKATSQRLGIVPRKLIPYLIRPGVIDFMDRRRTICRLAIGSKLLLLQARSRVGAVLKRLMGTSAYNLPQYFMKKIGLAT